MKKIFSTILVLLIQQSLSAQTILPIFNNNHSVPKTGYYYKDIDNYHDQFVGEWLYTNGSTSLKVVFRKLTNFHELSSDYDYYEDILVGEYWYIENNITKVNSLNNINIDHSSIFKYNLYTLGGRLALKYMAPICGDCAINEKRLILVFNELSKKINIPDYAAFAMRIVTVNGLPQLKVQFGAVESMSSTGNYTVPYQDYTFLKL